MKIGVNVGDYLIKMVVNFYFWIGFMVNNYYMRNEILFVYLGFLNEIFGYWKGKNCGCVVFKRVFLFYK